MFYETVALPLSYSGSEGSLSPKPAERQTGRKTEIIPHRLGIRACYPGSTEDLPLPLNLVVRSARIPATNDNRVLCILVAFGRGLRDYERRRRITANPLKPTARSERVEGSGTEAFDVTWILSSMAPEPQ